MLSTNKALFIWTIALIVAIGLLPFNKLWLLIFLAAFSLIFLCLWLVRDSTQKGFTVGATPFPDDVTDDIVFEPLKSE